MMPPAQAPSSPKMEKIQPEQSVPTKEPEIGGRKNGPEPTRYGDWELNGKCVDF